MQAKGLAATELDSSLRAPAADPSRKLETQEGGAAICLFFRSLTLEGSALFQILFISYVSKVLE